LDAVDLVAVDGRADEEGRARLLAAHDVHRHGEAGCGGEARDGDVDGPALAGRDLDATDDERSDVVHRARLLGSTLGVRPSSTSWCRASRSRWRVSRGCSKSWGGWNAR